MLQNCDIFDLIQLTEICPSLIWIPTELFLSPKFNEWCFLFIQTSQFFKLPLPPINPILKFLFHLKINLHLYFCLFDLLTFEVIFVHNFFKFVLKYRWDLKTGHPKSQKHFFDHFPFLTGFLSFQFLGWVSYKVRETALLN